MSDVQLFPWKMDSRIGPLHLVASATGLRGVFWEKQNIPPAKSEAGTAKAAKIISQAVEELMEYLNGNRRSFSVPLDVIGTDFQKQVWAELRKIPYGETVSYSDIAERIGNPKAMRAVGTANGQNPLSIIVPCHRVIAADGTLGGYAGGLPIKTKLLAIEKSKR